MSNLLKRNFKYLIYILLGIFSPFIFFAGLMLFPIVRNIITVVTGVTIGLIISLVLLLVFLFSFFASQKSLRKWSSISYSKKQQIFIYGSASVWWLITLAFSVVTAGTFIGTEHAKKQLISLIRRCWISGRLEFNENPSFGTMLKGQKTTDEFGPYIFIDPSTGDRISTNKASKSSCFDISAISSSPFNPSLRVTLPKKDNSLIIPPQNFTESLLIKSPEFNPKAWSIQKPNAENLKTTCKKPDSFSFGCDSSKNPVGKAW